MQNARKQNNILVVDDEEMIVDLISGYFSDLGYKVVTAGSAEEAINALNNGHDFHLVLTDINLPGYSGLELLKIIKETKENLPVVLLTGMKTLDTAISALQSGAADYITKPFDLASLRRVVEKSLKKTDRLLKKEQVYGNLQYITMNFSFTSKEMNVDALAKELANILKKMQFASDDKIKQFELVFSETFTNALEHGNLELPSSMKGNDLLALTQFEMLKEERLADPAYANRSIHVTFECNPDLFSLTVKDEGPGFNWKKYLDKDHRLSKVNKKAFGRGFNIIMLLIDEVHFNDKGNIITLIKERPQQVDS